MFDGSHYKIRKKGVPPGLAILPAGHGDSAAGGGGGRGGGGSSGRKPSTPVDGFEADAA